MKLSLFTLFLLVSGAITAQPFDEHVISSPNAGTRGFPVDVDGDGDLDVITTHGNFSFTIAWHENMGGGVFSNQHIISTNSYLTNSPGGDIDGDGDIDLVAILAWDHNPVIHENLGGGVFSPGQALSSSNFECFSFRLADLDGDSDLDFIYASKVSTVINWCINDGLGNFSTPQSLTPVTGLTGFGYINTADFDGDSDLDIVSVYSNDSIAWLENNGVGLFTRHEIGARPFVVMSTYPGDVDGDGLVDVIAAEKEYSGNILLYKNLGGGVFSTAFLIDDLIESPDNSTLGDLDGDGDQDIVSASDYGVWYENQGSGTFTAGQLFGNEYWSGYSQTPADMDGDGDLDVLAGGFNEFLWVENLRIDFPTSIEDPQNLLFSISPNPIQNDILYFNRSGLIHQDSEAYEITDLQGRVVLKGALQANKTSINLEGLLQGMYVLKMSGTSQKFTVLN